MITYDVYVTGNKNRKVMTLNEDDIVTLIREQARPLFPNDYLTIVISVETIKKED